MAQDPIVAKLIVSREKSIAVIDKELVRLRELAASASPSGVVAFESVIAVKQQRRDKLAAEVAAFRKSQPELPLKK